METIDTSLLRSARRARGWSQARLITALREQAERDRVRLMTPASLRVALSRWENGHVVPDEVHSRLLCRVLELDEGDVPPVRIARDSANDGSLFQLLTGHTNSLRMLDRRLGATAVRIQTAAHVAALEALWREAAGSDRVSIARAQADTAALAAWQDLDVGDYLSASRHYALAKRAASRAGDPVLWAHAVGEHAVLLAETGRAAAAVAQAAKAESMPMLPVLLRSWLAATHAQVAAALPGHAPSVRAALARAEADLLRSSDGDEEAMPYLALNAVHLQRWQGHILVRSGDPAGADATRAALNEVPGEFVRARCGQLLDLAEAGLGGGELEEARELLDTAAATISRLGSVRLGKRHELLSRRLRCRFAGD
ncbi:helix-turn-helix domain-containing protein [Nocardia abscessus]|uniref:helix-turn-helix domain-containing protein n=1 Tax=Nocardia abscessus TaxID=120957 RepID=UPI002454B95A|nr:helix-turn-helix transcriptional regulator [Nocardia abscessus]